tara:strand:- start:2055 stop:2888 length:834 start_codon:yes stop_codon:yes gene_type:complete
MNSKNLLLILLALVLTCLGIYLFVNAPPPLLDKVKQEKNTYSIEEGFGIIAELNDATRTFYTKEIVEKGKPVGLKFHEDWENNNIDAGPLPALFLRSTASFIEKSRVPLGLYLGSDFPIEETNLFEGIQSQQFKKIKKNKKPTFFYDGDIKRYVGMFPDFATTQACIVCHNEHKNSPKKNWKLNDVMGATTWLYPSDSLSTEELIDIISIYQKGVNYSFDEYLNKVKGFKSTQKPHIGDNWPINGLNLPSSKVLNDTVFTLTSQKLLKGLLKAKDEN